MSKLKKNIIKLTLLSTLCSTAYAGNVEVLHYWTSGGEAAALKVLQEMMDEEGHSWTDFAVAGGGGETAMTVLKSRAISGNPPTSSMIAGPEIQQWGELDVLENMDSVAKAENWDNLLPQNVADIHKYNGHYVAAPVNVHRINWMWINKSILDEVNKGEVPTTWDDFIAFLDNANGAGYIGFSHGGQDWQDATVFEQIALGTGGAEWYKKAFVELDDSAINSPEMTKTFERFRQLKSYMDKGMPGRDWNLATAQIIEGKAAVQIMGDWAKGEFTAAGKMPGKDYICAAVPGTVDSFSFNVDAFMMFNNQNPKNSEAQKTLSKLLVSREFQEEFNLKKGSIPVRPDVNLERFDSCAKLSMKDFKASSNSGNLVPSFAHAMAMTPDVSGAVYDVVTRFFNEDSMSAKQATTKLASAIKSAP
ncbi:ABC transporter substrate-binding protein [uncultured Vibrio sp.]|uniref:ABC transporter substrate-binding protein n=1 Tax=uncultured Vibrio sp. TaxID=114054 RepID=UPI0025CE3BD8|nr:ABC transporter substrate-binding protein [uncultured Vibrio sp.]